MSSRVPRPWRLASKRFPGFNSPAKFPACQVPLFRRATRRNRPVGHSTVCGHLWPDNVYTGLGLACGGHESATETPRAVARRQRVAMLGLARSCSICTKVPLLTPARRARASKVRFWALRSAEMRFATVSSNNIFRSRCPDSIIFNIDFFGHYIDIRHSSERQGTLKHGSFLRL